MADLTTDVGDGTVSLQWKTPPNVTEVVVRRSLQPPQDRSDGVLVPGVGPGSAQDTGLRNGRTYHYLICCVYRLSEGREVASPGLRCIVTPSGPPAVVSDFRVWTEGNRVVCTWSPATDGQVTVLRCQGPPFFRLGALLNAEELSRTGHRLPPSGSNRVEDPDPTPQEPYYAAFTVSGSRAIAGPVYSCIIAEDVENLQATPTGEGVKLSWEWSKNCQAVLIARRQGRWPEGLNDPQATTFHWSQSQYWMQQDGFHDRLEPDSEEYYYVVYAKPAGAPESIYAPGTSLGCRCQVRPVRPSRLKYGVKRVKRWFRSSQLELIWEADVYPQPFSGFIVLGNNRRAPQNLGDGIELFRWAPQASQDSQRGRHSLRIGLKSVALKRSKDRLYCKLFLQNPAEQQAMMIIHPDVSRPI